MRIGIDNISPGSSTSVSGLGGMRHFMRGLAAQLPAHGPAHAFELFTPAWNDRLALEPAANLALTVCHGVPRQAIGRVVYEQTWLPMRLRQRAIDVWLASCNTLPLAWKGTTVLIVQSLQYLTHPEAFPWLRRTYLRRVAVASLHSASHLVTFSNASKADLVQRAGVSESKISVVPHAVRFTIETTQSGGDTALPPELEATIGDSPFVLCVSAFYGYKNLFRLIEAFSQLKPELPHELVLVGAETAAVSTADLMACATRAGVAAHVRCVGRVSDRELAALYRHASVMAMPSLEETFGLPVLEAMAFGCPVITSDISSMPEIAGDAAVLVNPYDVDSIADGLRRVLTNPDVRQRMADEGRRRASAFTYDRFFRTLLQVIEGVSTST